MYNVSMVLKFHRGRHNWEKMLKMLLKRTIIIIIIKRSRSTALHEKIKMKVQAQALEGGGSFQGPAFCITWDWQLRRAREGETTEPVLQHVAMHSMVWATDGARLDTGSPQANPSSATYKFNDPDKVLSLAALLCSSVGGGWAVTT